MAAGRLLPLLLLLLGVPGGSGQDPPSGPAALAERCRLPAVAGRCRASIPRWFFDAPSGRCRRFVFGGCGGNGNNFGTESECRESCDPSSPAPTNSTSPEGCRGPPVPGPCRAAFPRWYFVPEENSCREFTYGGCRGSANNHRDEQECLRRCRATTGDFGAKFWRFLWSKGAIFAVLVALVASLLSVLALGRWLKPRAAPGPEDLQRLMKDPCPA